MELIIVSNQLADYVKPISDIIDINHPVVQQQIEELMQTGLSKEGQAELAFHFVRDEIDHSFDTKSTIVSVSASDALENGEGICFAKAHLLAAILRGVGIPTGFCYQRVLRKGTIDSGYALHGLNAIYLEGTGWFRVDPRGNKEGIHSTFSMETENLAYPIRPELGEIDYPHVFAEPLPSVIHAMRNAADCSELFYTRPEQLELA